MALVDINPTAALPGEAGLVALAGLFTELAKNLKPEQTQELAQRFLDLSQPYHVINVARMSRSLSPSCCGLTLPPSSSPIPPSCN
jgi:hypothetical protein